MTLAGFERMIADEASTVVKNKVKSKDIMEWSSDEIKPHDGEIVLQLPVLNVWVAIKKEIDKREV